MSVAAHVSEKLRVVESKEESFEYGPGQVLKLSNKNGHFRSTFFPSSPLYNAVKTLRVGNKVKISGWINFSEPKMSYVKVYKLD